MHAQGDRENLGDDFPAIMISGDTSSEIEALPGDAHLRFASKPIEASKLVATVRELLAQA